MNVSQTLSLVAIIAASAVRACADESPYDKGAGLLRQAAARYETLTSMTADMTEDWQYSGNDVHRSGTISLLKPNLSRLDYSSPNQLQLRDGTRAWWLNREDNRFSKAYADPGVIGGFICDENPAAFFFYTRGLVYRPVAEFVGTETIDGVSYQLVEGTFSQGRQRLYIGPDMIIHRITGRHNGRSFINSLTNIVLNKPSQAADFKFEPPPGARPAEKPGTAKLIPVGSLAPDFTVTTFDGRKQRLYELLKKQKAVIVHYWEHA